MRPVRSGILRRVRVQGRALLRLPEEGLLIAVVDYEISLSSGGRVVLVELDPGRIPELLDPDVVEACRGILERCTFAAREALEQAKRGYDKDLLRLLRAPDGGLLRASSPVCRLIDDCAMAVPSACTLRNLRKGKAGLPQCWEYGPPANLAEHVRRASIELGTAVGTAWREGSYPVVVDLAPLAAGRGP